MADPCGIQPHVEATGFGRWRIQPEIQKHISGMSRFRQLPSFVMPWMSIVAEAGKGATGKNRTFST
jgi:hypothetical protein